MGLHNRRSLNLSVPTRPNGPRWGLHYGIETNSEWSEKGRLIEEDVFVETLGYTPELVREEYDRFDDRSIWIVLANHHSGQAVGSIRAIVGPHEQLKLAEDLRERWNISLTEALQRHGVKTASGVVECGTVSVLPDWRKADSHWPVRALCAGFGRLVLELGGDWCVQLQDVSGPRLLRRQLGLPFDILANLDPVDFLGPVVPTISHVAKHFELFAEHTDPDFIALYAKADQSVRGGTSLPIIDLESSSSHRQALNRMQGQDS